MHGDKSERQEEEDWSAKESFFRSEVGEHGQFVIGLMRGLLARGAFASEVGVVLRNCLVVGEPVGKGLVPLQEQGNGLGMGGQPESERE